MTDTSVLVEGLTKSYGETAALRGLDLEVPAATVLGLLGPNGAGKTTAIRILATLLRPDAGVARVAGFDVVTAPDEVRARIGLTGQFAAVDDHLSGRENLIMIDRLAGSSKSTAQQRAAELLDRFGLEEAGDRLLRTYSGGMRRRLDLAASMVANPAVLFLDEPTTGLDPVSRRALWAITREIVAAGTTVVLTTQYLEEADELADDIVVIDHGRAIAHGTAQALKAQVGGERVDVRVADPSRLAAAAAALATLADGEIWTDAALGHLSFPAHGDAGLLSASVRALDAADIAIADLMLRRPSLDDVFVSLTGHVAEQSDEVTA